jgi:AcrR family transcriptional regulator
MMISEKRLLTFRHSDLMRTRILLSTEDLMQQISLDKLSVKEICKRTGVSRQTFYQHFKDKYDVAQWYWSELAEEYLKETGRTLNWYEGNLHMLEEFAARSSFFLNSFRSDNYNSCREFGYRRRIAFLQETVVDYRGLILTEILKFQIDFFANAESRSIVTWMKNGMDRSPEQMAHLLESCVPHTLHDALDMV